ncbi:MAG: LuxR C-terminal-related transcriptional regulator [Actinomycetota bacterium]|nr:LuxR C-terminal-related transcriptional regulator [Actinomycetota bacterium]
MASTAPTDRRVRLAEIIASLSLATDLATGSPIEHGLRRSLVAEWLGEELGLDAAELSDTYYVSLLGTVGCTIESSLFARYTADDITASAKAATVDFTSPLSVTAFVLGTFGSGQPPLRRARSLATAALSGAAEFQAVCRDVAVRVGDMLEIGPTIQQALAQCHERWNGRGGPKRLKGDEIEIAARIFHVAHDADIYARLGGIDAAVAIVRQRSGTHYDPAIAARFCTAAGSLFRRLEAQPLWDAVLAAEPAPFRWLSDAELDGVGRSIANFVDVRSTYTLGHSVGVARVAEATAARLGLAAEEVATIRRVGLLHDLGRAGVPVAVWNAPTPWTEAEWERARKHPALTELVLARSTALGHLGTLAGLHHERLDGSGYRGVTAASLPVSARIVAAADAYHTKLEPRPHRCALTPEAAAEELGAQAERGRLDPEVVRALLEGEGHSPPSPKREPPTGLSRREVEVLRLMAQGLSNREMAEILFISPKTVGHHVQHIYDKLGISTRVGATLYALQHGVVGEDMMFAAK